MQEGAYHPAGLESGHLVPWTGLYQENQELLSLTHSELFEDQVRTESVQSMRCPLSPSPVFGPFCKPELCTSLVNRSH